MKAYSTREVAALLQMTAARVRSFARAGFLHPDRGAGGEYRFSFQDIVLLRAARTLDEAGVSPRRVYKALRSMQAMLPTDRSLATVRISAAGDEVVVRDANSTWEPETGQAILDFDVAELARDAAPMVHQAARVAQQAADAKAIDWYQIGIDLETVGATGRAADAYRRALDSDSRHADARINLGRLHHDDGELEQAEGLYREALETEPDNVLGLFNLGVALDDQDLREVARAAYERVLEVDPDFADAHFNLARLHERDGQAALALQHLARYRTLTRER